MYIPLKKHNTGHIVRTFYSQFKVLNRHVSEDTGYCTGLEFAKNCFEVYVSMYNEIRQGYADGTRVIYDVESPEEINAASEKLTEADELVALDVVYDLYSQAVKQGYVDGTIGITGVVHMVQERIRVESIPEEKVTALEAAYDLYMQIVNESYIEKSAQALESLYERLLIAGEIWKEKYPVDMKNISQLSEQIFKENFVLEEAVSNKYNLGFSAC